MQPYVAPCQLVRRGWRRSGYLTDLGPRGAQVALRGEPPAVGSALTLELRLGRQVTRSRLRAVVRWVRAGDRGSHVFGLTFADLKVAERRALEAVVDEFHRRAAQIA
jgi:hypothetical protein